MHLLQLGTFRRSLPKPRPLHLSRSLIGCCEDLMVMHPENVYPDSFCPRLGTQRVGKWQRMPRSFLVKKPRSHRIPDYGQLLEAQTGLVLSQSQNEDSSIQKHEITEQRQTRPAPPQIQAEPTDPYDKTFLMPLALRMNDALSILAYELPLKDTMNNLNVQHRGRTCDESLSAAGVKATCNIAETPPTTSLSAGCLDFQKPGGLSKLRNCRYFSCPHCSKSYSSLGALKMHIRTHTLPCACRICGKAFSRPWLLQGHIRTHTGEKPFSCYHCGRGFADRSNLRAHLQTHSEIKRYQCPGCGKTFSRISLLTKHRSGCCCPVS